MIIPPRHIISLLTAVSPSYELFKISASFTLILSQFIYTWLLKYSIIFTTQH
jgi:hypothetical protein